MGQSWGGGCRYSAVILGIPKEEIDDCRLGSGTEGTESLGGTTEDTVRVRASPCCCSPSVPGPVNDTDYWEDWLRACGNLAPA